MRHPDSLLKHLRRLRTRRWPVAALVLALVFAQWMLATHAVKHAYTEPGEQHHCPLCIKADHSPAIAAAVTAPPCLLVATGATGNLYESVHPVASPSPFLARAPPAHLA